MVWLLVVLVVGVNLVTWGVVGALRLGDEAVQRRWDRRRPAHFGRSRPAPLRRGSPPPAGGGSGIALGDLAVLMSAHDEELLIGASLEGITQLVPASNVHVVSDFSTDDTVAIALAADVRVLETPENVGKAGALSYAMREGKLLDRYRAVMILDADTQLDPDYFRHALPLFDDPGIVAVAGCAHTRWQRSLGLVGTVAVATAERRPRYLLAGLLFIPMRVTDAYVALSSLPRAWSARSTGQWTSPTRRTIAPAPDPNQSDRKVLS